MAAAALVIYSVWAALAFGLRSYIQWRRTGDAGLRTNGGPPGSLQWWARVLFVAALAVGFIGPVLDIADIIEPLGPIDASVLGVAGVLLALAGVAATLATQMAMGDSWRVGVDPDERTSLITTGPFAVSRNPIFSAMALTAVGLALMVPNAVAVAGLAALAVALQLQVRGVEEPYLVAAHGEAYRSYASRVGRFLPSLGRSHQALPALDEDVDTALDCD